jgi:hypothetical protein
MKITQDVRDYAATLNDQQVGMAQMWRNSASWQRGVCAGGGGEGKQ